MTGGIWQKASNIYSRVLVNGDPRTQGWFLIKSPIPTIFVVALYFLMVGYGPRFMSNRKPLGLRPVIILYNFMLVFWSVYMFYEFTAIAITQRYSLACQPMDLTSNWMSLRIADCFWWYYFSKIVELLDTVRLSHDLMIIQTTFFILRKKFNQVSFLHVYHHSTMPLLMWLCVKYVAGGNCFIVGILNSLIHVFMYSYYALSAIGPHMQKYLWWKPYLTIAQLLQLGIILVHSFVNRFVKCDSHPYQYNYVAVVYCSSLIGLFANFYYRSYIRGKAGSTAATVSAKRANGSNVVVPNGTRSKNVLSHEKNGVVKGHSKTTNDKFEQSATSERDNIIPRRRIAA